MLGIFLDTETTGLDFRSHYPIEIAIKIVDLSQGEEKGQYQSNIAISDENWLQRDPGAIAINGFSRDELLNAKDIKKVSSEIIDFFTSLRIVRGTSVFICQNPSFDRAFFSLIVETYEQEKRQWPYHWLDLASMYWVRSVREWISEEELKKGFVLSKDQIAKRLGLPTEQKPHRAMNGVDHLLKCYEAVVGFPSKR